MKHVLILLIIIALIWGLNAYVCGFISSSAGRMMEHVQAAKTAAQQNNFEAAAQEIDQIRQIWERDESRWEAFTDHREAQLVDTSINHLEGMVDSKETTDMPPELQELEFLLRQMNDKHSFKIENVF